MKKADVVEFYHRLAEANPHPETELEFRNPYTLVVAVALSAQATDIGVNKATRALFAEVDTPEKMLELGEEGLKRHIRTIGLFNTKAKNVIALSQMLVDDYGGEVPKDRAALERLPGVGRKTANVVLNVAFGQETFAVDTHVFRVSQRLALARSSDPEVVHDQLVAVLPRGHLTHATHLLIVHGRRTCLARKPLCPGCPVRAWCPWPGKTRA